MGKRKICVVTGSRAEYGLLYWLMREINSDQSLALKLIVSGSHLETKFGDTYKTIEDDGFKIDASIQLKLKDDSPLGVSRSLALAIKGFAEALETINPDIVVILGDRFEVLGAAEAAMIAGFPIAHIHGGEATEGAFDDSIRHAITKMAHLHFASTESYRDRIIQMGEAPDRVFVVGAPGLDNILNLDLMDIKSLSTSVGIDLDRDYFLVTYHPVTRSKKTSSCVARAMIDALKRFSKARILFTGVNADPGNAAINRVISHFANENPARVKLVPSLGQVRYLSALKYCLVVVGNSSSGIIEAPYLGVPTVNIGERQKGRVRAPSIIDCGETSEEIFQALSTALSKKHRNISKKTTGKYGVPGASKKIKDILRNINLENILMKKFFDIPLSI